MPITKPETHYNPQTYTYSIQTHGSPFCLQTGGDIAAGTAQVQSGYNAAQHFSSGVPPEAKRIDLIACHSGTGGSGSSAQQLANKTGLPVGGYTSGTYQASFPHETFQPQTGISAQFSGGLNQAGASTSRNFPGCGGF
jgi:hypothetical protein